MTDLQARQAQTRNTNFASEQLDRRGSPRVIPLVQPAKLISGNREYFCIVRDASENGLKLHHFGHLPADTELQVELTNGERIHVRVVWQDGTHAGVSFDSSVDLARIVRLAHRDLPKRPLRMNTNISATLGWQDDHAPAVVTNLSVRGARAKCQQHFALDQLLRLTTGVLEPIYAKVRWRRGDEIGLVFETTLGFEDLARALAA